MITRIITAGFMAMVLMVTMVAAQGNPQTAWTCNGSTGTVDETSYDLTQYLNGAVFLSDWAPSSTEAIIRYNITATNGLSWGNRTIFKARVLDNGLQSRVILYVRAYHLTTGAITTLGQIDSDNYPASSGFQVMETGMGMCSFTGQGGKPAVNNFDEYAYYVEAHLMRTGWGGNPGLGLLWMKNGSVVC